MAPPKPILGVAQIEIVIDREETLDEDDVFLERKHNLIMQKIVPTIKLYHEQMDWPSSIGNVGGLPTDKPTIPMNINGGRPFDDGGN